MRTTTRTLALRTHTLIIDDELIALPEVLFVEDTAVPVIVQRGGQRTRIEAALSADQHRWLVAVLRATIEHRTDGSHFDVPDTLQQLRPKRVTR